MPLPSPPPKKNLGNRGEHLIPRQKKSSPVMSSAKTFYLFHIFTFSTYFSLLFFIFGSKKQQLTSSFFLVCVCVPLLLLFFSKFHLEKEKERRNLVLISVQLPSSVGPSPPPPPPDFQHAKLVTTSSFSFSSFVSRGLGRGEGREGGKPKEQVSVYSPTHESGRVREMGKLLGFPTFSSKKMEWSLFFFSLPNSFLQSASTHERDSHSSSFPLKRGRP